MSDPQIPLGLCQCGCGRATNVSKMTRRERGIVKGQRLRYLPGHNGRHLPPVGISLAEASMRLQAEARAARALQRDDSRAMMAELQGPVDPQAPKDSPALSNSVRSNLPRPDAPNLGPAAPQMLIASAGALLIPGVRFERPSPTSVPERQGLSIRPRRPSGAWLSGGGYGTPKRPAYRP